MLALDVWTWALLFGVALVAIFLVRRMLVSARSSFDMLAVRDDDPVMQEAKAKARASLPVFFNLLPKHREDAAVKFAFSTDAGETEHLWAQVLEADGGPLRVRVVTPPASHEGPFEAERTIERKDVEDWQIEMRDGTIRGGHTMYALFEIYRRDVGELPKDIAPHEERYVDCR